MRLTVTISPDDPARVGTSFTKTLEIPSVGEPPQPDLLVEYLASEARKELAVNGYWEKLPDISDLVPAGGKQSFRTEDFFSGRFHDRRNTFWVWLEIGRTLLRAKALLAEAKSYKELERGRGGAVTEDRALYSIQRRKLITFNLAVYDLCKIEDLLLRLLFENLGASIQANVDIASPGWERSLTWENFGVWLKKCKGLLPDRDYKEVRGTLALFRSRSDERRLVGYRDRLTHRPTPSVDYPELGAPMEDRVGVPISDAEGHRKGTRWAVRSPVPSKPDYTFSELYEWTVSTLSHYAVLLRRLKSMPRFS